MLTALPHPLEHQRLALLRELAVLDTPAEAVFDVSTRLVAHALDMPIALVSLVDAERQWFKSAFGIPVAQTSAVRSFCAHVVADESLLVVPDALATARFATDPLVVGAPRIRFYAGAPIMVEGLPMGALCVVDTQPRALDATCRQILIDTAAMVGHCLSKRLDDQRLRAAESIAQHVADRRCDWQWETDRHGDLVRITGDIGRATGLPAAEFLGRSLRAAAAGNPARFAAAWEAIAVAERDGRHWRGLPVGWRSAEGAITVTLDALPIHDAQGRCIGHRGTATDLDRPARALDEARRADAASRAKTELLSRISHEMRTPLNAIIGFSKLLLAERDAAGAPVLPSPGIDHIHAAGLELLRLVDDVLDRQESDRGHALAPSAASAAPSHGASAFDPRQEVGAAATILYVEDNPVNALLFEAVVAAHPQWALTVESDGASALALLASHTPDLLVIDANLSDTDGITLLHQMRALRPALAAVPAVMFTADAMPEQVAASRLAGFVDHWTKPMDVTRVVASMRSLLSPRR